MNGTTRVRRSRSLSYLPGRYLSRTPVSITQGARPIVVRGALERPRAKKPQDEFQAGRRPNPHHESRKSLRDFYFQKGGNAVVERLQTEQAPKTISEVLLAANDTLPDSDLAIASDLMREVVAEVCKTDRQLGRIAALVWRSYESCHTTMMSGAVEAVHLRSELDATRAELRKTRLRIAEQDGVIRFLNERRE